MRTRSLVALIVAIAACGDDGIHHLADAPPAPTDGPADAAPDAPDPKVSLNITIGGAGMGMVTSSPAGISCTTASCSADFDANTVVTLTAVPATGSVFAAWTGACTGTTPTCDVTLAQAASVTATFDVARYAVTVTKSGPGTGTVAGSGLDCGSTCTMMVDHGTMLSLTATPANLSVFAGWGGACSGTASCTTTVTGPTTISANFALDNLTLFVSKGGNGTGTVTATGINCGADCSESYTAGQMVTLTAAAGTGSTFTSWSGGGCSGTGTCTVTMTAATTVTATFTLQQFGLTVTKGGNGAGAVVSTPSGIACGADCTENYNYNTMVTLTATPSTGSTFTGWGGACSGTAMCVVTMTAARSVTANFTLQQFALTASVTGNGTVTSSPAGISCPTDCSQSYNYGQMVALTAAAGTGSTFTGWGGACSGTGTCTVTIDAAKSVTATFTLMQFPLTVTLAGAGSGSVASSPAGITCGADCSESYNYNTVVTLTATASTGSTFAGWSGACTGTGTCTVTMTAAASVTATFDVAQFALTVTEAGTGGGTVTSSPTGITCPTTCTKTYPYMQSVVLTAAPDTMSDFIGWSGGVCTGTGTCTVSMTQARAVTATFNKKQLTLTITKSGDGAGTVTGNGLSCGSTCSVTLSYGTAVSLTSTPDTANATASTFTAWSGGGCSGTGGCTFSITANTTVNAAYKLKPNLMFTSSVTYNGNLGGIAGGDSKCAQLATTRGLPGTYRAYLGATGVNAPSRFTNATGWTRVDGRPLVNAIGEFGTVALQYPPVLDEFGNDLTQSAQVRVWTATASTTGYYGQNCNQAGNLPDWSDGTGSRTMAGVCTATDVNVLTGAGVSPCPTPLHLYCFGIDRKATVP